MGSIYIGNNQGKGKERKMRELIKKLMKEGSKEEQEARFQKVFYVADIVTAGGLVDGSVCIICQKKFRCPDAFGPGTNALCEEYLFGGGSIESAERLIEDFLRQASAQI